MNTKLLLEFGAAACAIGLLAGCWTPPNANVQPKGQPGLIQDGITVKSVREPATVNAVDASHGTIVLELAGGWTGSFKTGPKVTKLDQIQVGNKIKATLTEELAIYVLENDRLPDGTTAQALGINAKVLLVDPNYRLLTVQYANGQSQTFKVDLEVRLKEMAPGDCVVVKPGEVTAIHLEKS